VDVAHHPPPGSSDTSLTVDAKLAEEVAKFQKNLFGFRFSSEVALA
jgi:hypothetical protein